MRGAFALPRRAPVPTRSLAAGAAFTVWAVAAVVLWLDLVWVPYTHVARAGLIYGLPLGVAAVAIMRRGDSRARVLPALAVAMCVTAGAMYGTEAVVRNPLVAIVVPGLLASALAARRWPAPFMIAALALTGTYGTVTAFTPVPPGQAVDVLLAGLWIGLAFGVVFRERAHRLVLWPGVVLAVVFLVLSIVAIPFAPDTFLATRSFRESGWYMLALVVVAYGGWGRHRLESVGKAFAVIALLVGIYATFRWQVGPAAKEENLVADPLYDQVGGRDKVHGSLPGGAELGLWTAIAIPYCVAAVITWRDRFRAVAALAIPFCIVALLGSESRTGLVAAAAGTALVLVVVQFSRGLPGLRFGIALTALLAVVMGGALAFPAVIGDAPESVRRYKNILTPERDESFQERRFKWQNAFADIEGHPLGRGLGTAGSFAGGQRFVFTGNNVVDNSYVKIAYEQGFVMMALFMATVVVLLFGLVRRGVWSRSPSQASAAICACGSLAAFVLMLVTGLFINLLPALTAWMLAGLAVGQSASLEPDDG